MVSSFGRGNQREAGGKLALWSYKTAWVRRPSEDFKEI